MRPTTKLSTFRLVNRLEDHMMRAMMPRTNAADPLPAAFFANTRRSAKTLAPLTFKLGAVAMKAVQQ